MSIIQHIAPYINQREAFAEAVLVEALESQQRRDKFQELTAIDGRSTLTKVVRQIWSADGDARHDIILRTNTDREFRVELKGSAPFTTRQQKALQQGISAPHSIRIDVLIHSSALQIPDSIHKSVKRITWDRIDADLFQGKHPLGRLADLWRNSSTVHWRDVAKDARAFTTYYRVEGSTGDWWTLWSSIDYIRSSLCSQFNFRRVGGPRTAIECSYYGTWISSDSGSWWLGWIFTGGQRGPFKAALVLEEDGRPCHSDSREAMPHWYDPTACGVVLANMSTDVSSGVIRLDDIADEIRRVCR